MKMKLYLTANNERNFQLTTPEKMAFSSIPPVEKCNKVSLTRNKALRACSTKVCHIVNWQKYLIFWIFQGFLKCIICCEALLLCMHVNFMWDFCPNSFVVIFLKKPSPRPL